MILTKDFFLSSSFCFLISFFFIKFLIHKKILVDNINFSKHKKLDHGMNKIPLCGGIILYLSSLVFFENDLIILKIFGLLILILGIFSDLNIISAPKTRLLFQSLIIIFFIVFSDLQIVDLRINLINDYLAIKNISILFTVFCILILINGANFLDGLNTLVIGYFLLVVATLLLLSNQFDLDINFNVYYFFSFLIIIYIYNFFGKLFLGDSGAYLIAFLTSFFILDFIKNNDDVSPYLICLLLWYPAFENLFSIIRRRIFKQRVDQPDQNHLHHLIYNFLSKKKFFKRKIVNTLSANIINLYNIIIFMFFFKYYLYTDILVKVILLNVLLYLILYFSIKKKINHF